MRSDPSSNDSPAPVADAALAPTADEHTLLADPTRRAILRALGVTARPVGAHEVAVVLGLHVNSVREQLHRLETAGRVRSSAAPAVGRGRPKTMYAIDPRGGRDPHRALVLGLVDQLAEAADGVSIARAAGRRWGEDAAAAERASQKGAPRLSVSLTAMVAREGFAPEAAAAAVPEAGSDTAMLRLRSCPYLPLAPQQLRIVCGVHLGYLEGSIRGLGAADADVTVSLEPFAEPDACLAAITIHAPIGDPAHG